MNKILVSNIIDLDKGIYNLEFNDKKCELNINGVIKCYIYNQNISELEINMNENSILYLYNYNDKNNRKLKVCINQNNNSRVYYNGVIINNNDIFLEIDNNIMGNNNLSTIKIRDISYKEKAHIKVNVIIKEETIGNVALEDLKGINNGGFIEIDPNIICASNEMSANHLTTIGSLDKVSLNYLMSKGLDESIARNMLLDGFINSILDDVMQNLGG